MCDIHFVIHYPCSFVCASSQYTVMLTLPRALVVRSAGHPYYPLTLKGDKGAQYLLVSDL